MGQDEGVLGPRGGQFGRNRKIEFRGQGLWRWGEEEMEAGAMGLVRKDGRVGGQGWWE